MSGNKVGNSVVGNSTISVAKGPSLGRGQHAVGMNIDVPVSPAEVPAGFDTNADGRLAGSETAELNDVAHSWGLNVKADAKSAERLLGKLSGLLEVANDASSTVNPSELGAIEVEIGSTADPEMAKVAQTQVTGLQAVVAQTAGRANLIGFRDFLTSTGAALERRQQTSSIDLFGQGGRPGALFGPRQTLVECCPGGQMTSEFQSRFSQFAGQSLTNDPMAFVQWVLRESYLETTNCLYDYAKKVEYFNESKRVIRNQLSAMRNFNTKWKEHGRAKLGIKDITKPETWTAEQAAGMQEYAANQSSANHLTTQVYLNARKQSATACATTANNYMSRAYGTNVKMPPKLETQLKVALNSQNPSTIKSALTRFAQFLSYLGDCGVKNGVYGAGGCNDASHKSSYGRNGSTYDSSKAMADFEYYMSSSNNQTARSNLASGDIKLIEAAFDVGSGALGISGSSSVDEVVAAAFKPVNDKWAHHIADGIAKSSSELNSEIRENGPNSRFAIELYGSPEAASSAYWGHGKYSEEQLQIRKEFGISDGLPPPGIGNPQEMEDGIKDLESTMSQVGDDAQLANVDLQNWLQKQQQTLQMMSNISKMLNDTAMAVIRKIG